MFSVRHIFLKCVSWPTGKSFWVRPYRYASHYTSQLFWRNNFSAWWRACVRRQHLESSSHQCINKVKCHHIITDTTQKHVVLQIITILGNILHLLYQLCATNVLGRLLIFRPSPTQLIRTTAPIINYSNPRMILKLTIINWSKFPERPTTLGANLVYRGSINACVDIPLSFPQWPKLCCKIVTAPWVQMSKNYKNERLLWNELFTSVLF